MLPGLGRAIIGLHAIPLAAAALRAALKGITALVGVALLAGCAGWTRSARTGGGYPPPGEVRGVDMTGGVPSSGATYAGSQRVLVRGHSGILFLAYTKRIRGVDQLYVARYNGSRWLRPVELTTFGRNAYPNVHWSCYNDWTVGGKVDYAWTQVGAEPGDPLGKNRIRVASVSLIP